MASKKRWVLGMKRSVLCLAKPPAYPMILCCINVCGSRAEAFLGYLDAQLHTQCCWLSLPTPFEQRQVHTLPASVSSREDMSDIDIFKHSTSDCIIMTSAGIGIRRKSVGFVRCRSGPVRLNGKSQMPQFLHTHPPNASAAAAPHLQGNIVGG